MISKVWFAKTDKDMWQRPCTLDFTETFIVYSDTTWLNIYSDTDTFVIS